MPISADELDKRGLQVRNCLKAANPKQHRFTCTRFYLDSKSPELLVNTDQDVLSWFWVGLHQVFRFGNQSQTEEQSAWRQVSLKQNERGFKSETVECY